MRDKALEFDNALSKVKTQNEELLHKAQQCLGSLVELLGTVRQSKCSVCVTRELDTVCLPCGHAFCANCAGRAERTRCHACRTRVERTARVYF